MKELNLKDRKKWELYVQNNKDPYGKACVDVARKVMEYLDKDNTPLHPGYHPDEHTAHGMIVKADEEIEAGGLTGFMAGAVAKMIFDCHVRGEEFKDSFNGEAKSDDVVNPAVISIEV